MLTRRSFLKSAIIGSVGISTGLSLATVVLRPKYTYTEYALPMVINWDALEDMLGIELDEKHKHFSYVEGTPELAEAIRAAKPA